MTTYSGMDVAAVEAAAKQLKNYASRLDTLTAEIGREVGRLPAVWEGRDAQQFVNDWWPKHKGTLNSIARSVEGLGQSAWNNAQDQRGASSDGGGASASASAPVAPVAPQQPAANPAAGSPPSAYTGWAAAAVGRDINVDGAFGNQCWDVAADYAKSIWGNYTAPGLGGVEVAANVWSMSNPDYFDKIPVGSGSPQAGDIICIGAWEGNSAGHVAVVTGVDAQGIHVIQQDGRYPDQPAKEAVLGSFYDGKVQGYLRPKV